MKDKIEITHPNGYKGILYGNSSMVVLKENEEVLHTGFRKINTEKELYNYLESFPGFYQMLNEATEELLKSEVSND